MNRSYLRYICVLILTTQILDATPKQKYYSSLMEKIQETAQSMMTSAVAIGGLLSFTTGAALPAACATGAAIGLGGRLYQYYSANPSRCLAKSLDTLEFVKSLETIQFIESIKNLNANGYVANSNNEYENYILMGGKEYCLLSERFKDIANTGYSIEPALLSIKEKPIDSTVLTRSLQNIPTPIMKEDYPYNQYEIDLMPQNKDVGIVFKIVIDTLVARKDLGEHVAVVAVRARPEIYSNPLFFIRQVLPRIVIIFKNDIARGDVQALITKLNELLIHTEPSPFWPRYSNKTINYGTINAPNMIFVGYGNTDFKSRFPWLFERKKWFGISQPGDMAYPITKDINLKIYPIKASSHLPRWIMKNTPTVVSYLS